MRKIFLILGILLLVSQIVDAKIVPDLIKNNNNYYYPPNNVRYTGNTNYYNGNYYNNRRRYYQPRRYYNNYYNQQPVIYRSRYRRSSSEIFEKSVSNQFSDINKLEKQILFQTYEYDLPKNRIERLEQKIFGASQSGSLEERIITLKSAAKNYKAYDPNGQYCSPNGRYNAGSFNDSYNSSYRPPITGTLGSSWKNNLLGNFRNQLMGTPTGFTPAMDPAYMDWFEAERAMSDSGQSSDYINRRGYKRTNTSRGASSGVTILD